VYPLYSGLKCLDEILLVDSYSEYACMSPEWKRQNSQTTRLLHIARGIHVHIYLPSITRSTPYIPRECSSTLMRRQACFRAEIRRVCKRIRQPISPFSSKPSPSCFLCAACAAIVSVRGIFLGWLYSPSSKRTHGLFHCHRCNNILSE
jgi:hypothetical protein